MNPRIIRFLLGATIAAATALLLLAVQVPAPARAIGFLHSINVNILTDEYTSGTGTGCSLREAIRTANDSLSFGDCLRLAGDLGSGPDTILLPSGIYTLTRTGAGEDLNTTGDLDIRRSVIISATGALPIVAGGVSWTDRIFDIVTGTVTFKGFAIRGGHADPAGGGGVVIEFGQSLTYNDGEVSDNSGSFGGGVDNDGNVTFTNVTFSGNSATDVGGGISNFGTATLTNVTLSGNAATNFGGGISNFGTAMLTNQGFRSSGLKCGHMWIA